MKRRKATPKKAAFLAAYAKVGNVTHAAQLAKCNRQHVYVWLKEEEFSKQFDEAGTEATERLEKEARRRAVRGTLKPVFHQGAQCGAIREYSDTLLIFLLKGRKPETYRDNVKAEHVGTVGVVHSGRVDVRQVVDEFEQQIGPDLETVARNRLGIAVPCLSGAGTDGAAALAIPGSAARGPNGSNGNGSHQGPNGSGHSHH